MTLASYLSGRKPRAGSQSGRPEWSDSGATPKLAVDLCTSTGRPEDEAGLPLPLAASRR
ncbi:MAG: hypothetical protein QOI16_3879, partial [Pseudonocardiales bacterium]|nr:hypothetical protein [Pseudonocardiales bacterium]